MEVHQPGPISPTNRALYSLQDESIEPEGWHSGCRRTDLTESLPIDSAHRAIYERAEQSLSFGFSQVQRALVALQLQLQMKLRQLKEQQELIYRAHAGYCGDDYLEFQENVKKN